MLQSGKKVNYPETEFFIPNMQGAVVQVCGIGKMCRLQESFFCC
jgi:hypothetical protein